MKKLFIFSDVHSFFTELKKALDNAGFDIDNPDHIAVSLGDLCDRGPESAEVLKFINSIPVERKICIIGNHELMMEEMIGRGFELSHDVYNGTVKTVRQLTGIKNPEAAILEMQHNYLWNLYKKSWRLHAEIGDMIFVHGWIPSKEVLSTWGIPKGEEFRPDWRNASEKEWEKATWANGMKMWSNGVREEGKTIFCGHWHTSWGHAYLHNYGVEFVDDNNDPTVLSPGTVWPFACFDPFIDDGIVAMDACTALSHQVNVVVREVTDEAWADIK